MGGEAAAASAEWSIPSTEAGTVDYSRSLHTTASRVILPFHERQKLSLCARNDGEASYIRM